MSSRPTSGRSIYLMPLAERRRRLLAIDWVEDASVSRIWPNRILVRITERKPVAFVNLPVPENSRASRLALIDAEGVFSGPAAAGSISFPGPQGVTEQQTEADRRLRVEAMQRPAGRTRAAGEGCLGNQRRRTSKTCGSSPQVDGRAVELELGDGGFAALPELS